MNWRMDPYMIPRMDLLVIPSVDPPVIPSMFMDFRKPPSRSARRMAAKYAEIIILLPAFFRLAAK